ncbi:PD-(D/E)XK nuclease family protein, partial [Kaarinaea lacus]
MQQQSFPFATPRENLITVPIDKNLSQVSCDVILQQHAHQLPDLSKVTVLLADNYAANSFKSVLLSKAITKGCKALLGPRVTSLLAWLKEQVAIDPYVVSNQTRELLLIDALDKHENIYGHGSPWVLADSLIELFNELTHWQVELPVSVDDFIEKLGDAYGNIEQIRGTLGREAILVHTLWYAMHQQLSHQNMIDQNGSMLLRLGNSLELLPGDQQLYYCTTVKPTPAEQKWRNHLFERKQLHVISIDPLDSAPESTAPDFVKCLDLLYDIHKNNFVHRTQQCRQQFPVSPVDSVIRIYTANDSEDEALAVDYQVRCWLVEGKTSIGIVTENRKLARRIRALLERADVFAEDTAGWPLSTTSAASVLERWLESVENDFHYLPLLDCLKSPFFLEHSEEYLQLVYFLEQHIIVDENIASGIQRFQKHIEFRKQKLPDRMATESYNQLEQLLDRINHAAEPLLPLCNGDRHNALDFIEALLNSMTRLDISNAYTSDAAGIQILNEIDELKRAAVQAPVKMTWSTFRNWLGLALERFNFKNQDQQSTVKLLTLDNSGYYSFDAVVIAGAEQEYLPRRSRHSPFFNDAVRSALGIPTQNDQRELSFHLFRRLLVSTPADNRDNTVFITYRARDNDEEVIPSPWVAELQAFHAQTYDTDLKDQNFSLQFHDSASHISLDNAELPVPINSTPRTSSPRILTPKSMSASAYQQLINCPYQFFAARCLKLAPPDTVREALQKSDYGERVHQCLEAFHSNVQGLPGPYTENLTPQNQQQAIRQLTEISERVFSSDIEDNFMHRGWLKRWLKLVPLYIEWQ